MDADPPDKVWTSEYTLLLSSFYHNQVLEVLQFIVYESYNYKSCPATGLSPTTTLNPKAQENGRTDGYLSNILKTLLFFYLITSVSFTLQVRVRLWFITVL